MKQTLPTSFSFLMLNRYSLKKASDLNDHGSMLNCHFCFESNLNKEKSLRQFKHMDKNDSIKTDFHPVYQLTNKRIS
jgi:site-specific DNA-adenine methylase